AWYEQVCKPGLRSVRWLTYRYVVANRSGGRPRLPARYELGRLAYELGVGAYTGRRFIGLGRPDLEHAWDSDRRSQPAHRCSPLCQLKAGHRARRRADRDGDV